MKMGFLDQNQGKTNTYVFNFVIFLMQFYNFQTNIKTTPIKVILKQCPSNQDLARGHGLNAFSLVTINRFLGFGKIFRDSLYKAMLIIRYGIAQ